MQQFPINNGNVTIADDGTVTIVMRPTNLGMNLSGKSYAYGGGCFDTLVEGKRVTFGLNVYESIPKALQRPPVPAK